MSYFSFCHKVLFVFFHLKKALKELFSATDYFFVFALGYVISRQHFSISMLYNLFVIHLSPNCLHCNLKMPSVIFAHFFATSFMEKQPAYPKLLMNFALKTSTQNFTKQPNIL
jgi:hypothetical protein